jgi:hypothetical protein
VKAAPMLQTTPRGCAINMATNRGLRQGTIQSVA